MPQSTKKSAQFITTGWVDVDNLDHAPDLAAALGNMVVGWARAETAIVKTYAVVTKLHYNEAAAAYYTIPTFESRTKTLLALIEEISSHTSMPNVEAIRAAVESFVELSKTRNEWVHAIWVCREGSTSVQTINMKQSPKTRRAKQITATAVLNHVKAVRAQTQILEGYSPLKIALRS